jgi:hypothetical protein
MFYIYIRMKLTETIYSIILKEYSEGVMRRLIDKFKSEQSNLTDTIIISYINDFKKISEKLENRDIMTYSWKDLETTVDSNRSTRIKAGKIDVTAEDANLLYNRDGVRIYHGKDKKACIKYSNGYSFCIGARGKNNMYSMYRQIIGGAHQSTMDKIFNVGPGSVVGTPYFVFNDNMDKEDPNHVLVIFEYAYDNDKPNPGISHYTVTNADNNGDQEFVKFSKIVAKYPWVKPLENVMVADKGLSAEEKEHAKQKEELESSIKNLKNNFLSNFRDKDLYGSYIHLFEYLEYGIDYLNNEITPRERYNAMMNGMNLYQAKLERDIISQKYIDDGETDANLKIILENVGKSFMSGFILAKPDDFITPATNYIKRFMIPFLKEQGIKGIEGPYYDSVVKYCVYSMDRTKRLHRDLQRIKDVTINNESAAVIEQILKLSEKIMALDKKYRHIA